MAALPPISSYQPTQHEPTHFECDGQEARDVRCRALGYSDTPFPKPILIRLNANRVEKIVSASMIEWIPCHPNMVLLQLRRNDGSKLIPTTWQLIVATNFSWTFASAKTAPCSTYIRQGTCVAWFTASEHDRQEAERISRAATPPANNPIQGLTSALKHDWYIMLLCKSGTPNHEPNFWIKEANRVMNLNWEPRPHLSNFVPNGYLGNASKCFTREKLTIRSIWHTYEQAAAIDIDGNNEETLRNFVDAGAETLITKSHIDFTNFEIRCRPFSHWGALLTEKRMWSIVERATYLASVRSRHAGGVRNEHYLLPVDEPRVVGSPVFPDLARGAPFVRQRR